MYVLWVGQWGWQWPRVKRLADARVRCCPVSFKPAPVIARRLGSEAVKACLALRS